MKTYESHQFIHFHDPTRPLPDSYFITAEKPWKHISLKFKGLQILVHSTVGKIQQQKHAAMVLKNKTEIIKN